MLFHAIYISALLLLGILTLSIKAPDHSKLAYTKIFRYFTGCLFFWALFKYFAMTEFMNYTPLFWYKISIIFAGLTPFLVYWLSVDFCSNQRKKIILAFTVTLFGIISFVSPIGITQVDNTDMTISIISYNFGYIIYSVNFIILYAVALKKFHQHAQKRALPWERANTRLLEFIIGIGFVTNLLFAILPDIFGIRMSNLAEYGEVPIILISAICLAYGSAKFNLLMMREKARKIIVAASFFAIIIVVESTIIMRLFEGLIGVEKGKNFALMLISVVAAFLLLFISFFVQQRFVTQPNSTVTTLSKNFQAVALILQHVSNKNQLREVLTTDLKNYFEAGYASVAISEGKHSGADEYTALTSENDQGNKGRTNIASTHYASIDRKANELNGFVYFIHNDTQLKLSYGQKKYSKEFSQYDLEFMNMCLLYIHEKLSQYDISNEYRKKLEILKRQNKKLRSENKAKDDFVSIASHQLKTPVTICKNLTYMMNNGVYGTLNSEQEAAVDNIERSLHKMHKLISDLLDVAKVNVGSLSLSMSNFCIADLLKEQIDDYSLIASEKSINIESIIEDEVYVIADRKRIADTIGNILDNAIKYTKPNKTIQVRLYINNDQVYCQVKDSGIGIPKKDLKYLFGKFRRSSNARKHAPDGTGLGLYLAKNIIALHGGEMIIDSKLGAGTKAGFSLPVA